MSLGDKGVARPDTPAEVEGRPLIDAEAEELEISLAGIWMVNDQHTFR
jgi:hypothetical protein